MQSFAISVTFRQALGVLWDRGLEHSCTWAWIHYWEINSKRLDIQTGKTSQYLKILSWFWNMLYVNDARKRMGLLWTPYCFKTNVLSASVLKSNKVLAVSLAIMRNKVQWSTKWEICLLTSHCNNILETESCIQVFKYIFNCCVTFNNQPRT